ncbi:MAG: hypothetical protein HYX74_01080, partial [Acidobacteria bacterium]|nr:hypothetical protein [Acidobacteriota bacterium]
ALERNGRFRNSLSGTGLDRLRRCNFILGAVKVFAFRFLEAKTAILSIFRPFEAVARTFPARTDLAFTLAACFDAAAPRTRFRAICFFLSPRAVFMCFPFFSNPSSQRDASLNHFAKKARKFVVASPYLYLSCGKTVSKELPRPEVLLG